MKCPKCKRICDCADTDAYPEVTEEMVEAVARQIHAAMFNKDGDDNLLKVAKLTVWQDYKLHAECALRTVFAAAPPSDPVFCKSCGVEVCPSCGHVHLETPEMICLDKWHRDQT